MPSAYFFSQNGGGASLLKSNNLFFCRGTNDVGPDSLLALSVLGPGDEVEVLSSILSASKEMEVRVLELLF